MCGICKATGYKLSENHDPMNHTLPNNYLIDCIKHETFAFQVL